MPRATETVNRAKSRRPLACLPGDSGLRLSDSNGNSILLTQAGNTTTTSNAAVGQITSNALQFQIGIADSAAHQAQQRVAFGARGHGRIANRDRAVFQVNSAHR